MQFFQKLIQLFGSSAGHSLTGENVHAMLTGYPDRLPGLQQAVESLLPQVSNLRIFLDNFDQVPSFLANDRIFLTRSQDFGNLGECGKYYRTDDLEGYCLVCSDKLVYPKDYVAKMMAKIEEHGRKAVIAAGGWKINDPFVSFSESTTFIDETGKNSGDQVVPLLNDLALAYHSSTIRVSRHYFYQPELSAFWFSIMALEQNVPMVCFRHGKDWLAPSGASVSLEETGKDDYKTFLLKSYFINKKEKAGNEPADINTYFDKIYAMNLDRRPDRWEKILKISDKYNLNITRFPAVDGSVEPVKSAWENYARSALTTLPKGIEPLEGYRDKFLKYHHNIARVHFMESKLNRKAMQSPGAWGYALSYINILKEAIQKNYHRIMILDDDIVLHKSFNELINIYLNDLPKDWKLIMMGAMQHYWEPWITPYSDLLYHCHGSSVASHAVGIDRKVFLPLLYYCEKLDLPVDEGAIFHIQNVYDRQCFIFRPNLIIQDMRESDINTSAMKQQQVEEWMKLFRWNIDDYDFM